jgi:hypothetical protein
MQQLLGFLPQMYFLGTKYFGNCKALKCRIQGTNDAPKTSNLSSHLSQLIEEYLFSVITHFL